MFFYDHKTMNKVAKVILWIFFICLIIVGCSQLYDSGHKAMHPKEARQESITASNNKKKANIVLAKQLADDRKEAQSSNNTNQSDPASGLNYTTYVTNVKYTGNNDLTVEVTSDFQNLNDQQKTSVVNAAQGMARSTLWKNKIINQSTVKNNLFTTVQLGSNGIGRSTVGNLSQFKWY